MKNTVVSKKSLQRLLLLMKTTLWQSPKDWLGEVEARGLPGSAHKYDSISHFQGKHINLVLLEKDPNNQKYPPCFIQNVSAATEEIKRVDKNKHSLVEVEKENIQCKYSHGH